MYFKADYRFENGGKTIFGELFLPSIHSDVKRPVVILSHGFGSTGKNQEEYASMFADNGYVAYTFDFIGGGEDIRSDGKMTEMSVLTEASDLEIILEGIRNLPFVDRDNVILMGNSQGGFVSTYVAAKNKDKVSKLILLYPAFGIPDNTKRMIEEADTNKEIFEVLGKTVSRKYGIDAMNIDIFDLMKNFDKEVLIIHGENDDVVPIAYSEKAIKIFKNAKLKIVKNAGHGFHKEKEIDTAKNSIAEFLSE